MEGGNGGRETKIMRGGGGGGNVNKSWRKMDKILSYTPRGEYTCERILVVVLNVLRDAYYYPIPFPSIPRLSTLPRSVSSLRTYSQS